MEKEKENRTISAMLFHEWLNNLSMYSQELSHLQDMVNGRRYRGIQLDASIELEALSELITERRADVANLSSEVLSRLRLHEAKGSDVTGVIQFSEIISNNQLRERIRKAERSVFYLKYHVNKILSKAS